MKLGISSALEHTDPHDWALKHKRMGLECVNFPVDHTAGEEVFMAYKEAADEAGLMIAEVGVWRNTLARDPEERERWIRYAIGQLEMADRIGARVDRDEFGAHLDVVNMITSPERYFFNELFIEECFEKLDGRICSCHLKDVLLKQEYTFQLEECACGQGTLDIGRYADLASAQDPDMPMIIEHLDTDSEYRDSVMYVRNRLLQLGDGGVPDGA